MEQVAVIPKILVLTIWNCTTWVLQRWLRRPFVGETTVMISSWSIVALSIEVWALRAQKCRSPWKKFISLVQRELRQAGQMLLLMGVHWIRSLVFSYMLLLVVNNCEKWRTPTFKASSSSFFFFFPFLCVWLGNYQRCWCWPYPKTVEGIFKLAAHDSCHESCTRLAKFKIMYGWSFQWLEAIWAWSNCGCLNYYDSEFQSHSSEEEM